MRIEPTANSVSITFQPLQQWEGEVIKIGDDHFVTRLFDLTTDTPHECIEEATIPLTEISKHDAENLAVGKIFRWVIGYEKSPAGTKRRVSQIVFCDFPKMTETDLREGKKWADEMASFLNSGQE